MLSGVGTRRGCWGWLGSCERVHTRFRQRRLTGCGGATPPQVPRGSGRQSWGAVLYRPASGHRRLPGMGSCLRGNDGWIVLVSPARQVGRSGTIPAPHLWVPAFAGTTTRLSSFLRHARSGGVGPHPHRPSCMFRVMAGQTVALLVKETVTQLGRPAKSILEPEQLPGQVQARIGKDGPRRNDVSDAQEVFVGIDVAKEWFDVAVRPGNERWRGSQDEAGVAALTDRLRQLRPHLVIMEASGGYERLIAAALGAAGLPIAVVNPRQVRDLPAHWASWPKRTGSMRR